MTYHEILKIKDPAARDAYMLEAFDRYGFLNCINATAYSDPIAAYMAENSFSFSASLAFWAEALAEYDDQAGDTQEHGAIIAHCSMLRRGL